jgi:hypothetical protein
MTTRRLTAFLDALAAGRRPRPFEADAEDIEMLRVAIALRAARPGDALPNEGFVAELHQQLAEDAAPSEQKNVRPVKMHRGRAALVAVAAGLTLVGGTFALTEVSNTTAVHQSATAVPHGQALRTATFETPSGQVLGQIVVYRGHPSWVFMNVAVPQSNGTMKCELHLANGEVVAAGTVQLHDGSGRLSKTIQMDSAQVQDATLSNSSGAVEASATFA